MTPARLPKAIALLCGTVFVLSILPYLQTATFELINYDDPIYTEPPSRVAEGLGLSALQWAFTSVLFNWHPLTWISLMIDYSLFGGSPGAMHLHSALLHAINGVLLFVVLLRMTDRSGPSLAVALLFALHPLRVEAVVWIAARKDVLNALFWLLSINCYIDYARRRDAGKRWAGWYALCAVCMALGLMAKGMIVSLPIVLLLLDVWPMKRVRGTSLQSLRDDSTRLATLLLEKVPLLLLAMIGVAITVFGQIEANAINTTAELPITARLINAVIAVATYLFQLAWPINLSIFYPHYAVLGEPTPWLLFGFSAVLLIGVTVVCVRRAISEPYLLVGWLWFLVTLLPVLGIIQIGGQSHADRYTYVPSIGILIGVVWSVADFAARSRVPRWLPIGLTGAGALTLSLLTTRQVSHWKNSETLFTHAIDVTPASYVARNQLGLALIDRGALRPAAEQFALSVDIYPRYAMGHNNFAIALQKLGDVEGALEHYDLALQIDPLYVDAMINLGSLLSSVGERQQAVPYFAKVVELRPDDASAHYDYGLQLAAAGMIEQALDQFEITLGLDPTHHAAPESVRQAKTLIESYRRGSSTGMMAASRPATQATTRPSTTRATSQAH